MIVYPLSSQHLRFKVSHAQNILRTTIRHGFQVPFSSLNYPPEVGGASMVSVHNEGLHYFPSVQDELP